MAQRRIRIAVDVGGTFTDVTLWDPRSGRLVAAKALTTPHDRAVGVENGVALGLEAAEVKPEEVLEVVHGSTTGTNALIERTGATVGLLTTSGFRDVLEIGRIMRPDAGLYDFSVDSPLPLVPRYLRLEARERLDAQGHVLVPLDEHSVVAAAQRFARERVEALAVCFLFSFLNPEHEERAAAILARHLPGIPISLSSRVCPEVREYERSSTTVINAYLAPVMSTYLDSLRRRIEHALGPVRLSVIQANGGSTSVAAALRTPVTTVNSGPAGGVVAAAYYGRLHERNRLVSVDMGGTSFDIGLVEDGASKVTTDGSFQDLPVRIPIIDLHIIGAGGGSIAWIDAGGALNVGPRSAGAEPGPACYGRGGDRPTVTDANLILGYLDPSSFLGGTMAIDVAAARAALESDVAQPLGLDVDAAAGAVLEVATEQMVHAIEEITVNQGIDPREAVLVGGGGAAGLNAVAVARRLGCAGVLFPPVGAALSAAGALLSDLVAEFALALPTSSA